MIRLRLLDLAEPEAADRLDEQDHRAVGLAHQLQHRASHPDIEEILARGFFHVLMPLRHQADDLALGQAFVHQLERGGPAEGQRHNRTREDHHAPDRQDGQHRGNFGLLGAVGRVRHRDDGRGGRLCLRGSFFFFGPAVGRLV